MSLESPFLPKYGLKQYDVSSIDVLKSKIDQLLAFPINNKKDLETFTHNWDILSIHLHTEGAETMFQMTRNTADASLKQKYEFFVSEIRPLAEKARFNLNKKFINSKFASKLNKKYDIVKRAIRNEIKLFNPKNVDLKKKEALLSQKTVEFIGGLSVEWEGKKITIPELQFHLKNKDREIRERAYQAFYQAKLSISDEIDRIYQECLTLRQRIAINSGFKNYRDYRFFELRRFDYKPKDCISFHKAVFEHFVPLNNALMNRRKHNLKLDSLRPWDISCDELGRDPLLVYPKENTQALIEGCEKIIASIDSELLNFYNTLKSEYLLDLDSRHNKAQGGYMELFPLYKRAVIFSNGVGVSRDLMTLLHEAGHCFHYFLGNHLTPFALQDWTSEIAEVGSMSMEYFGIEKMEAFLSKEATQRIKEEKLIDIAHLFCSVAMVDEFQHWVYTTPRVNKKSRRDKYLELSKKYFPSIDRIGYEDLSRVAWQFTHVLEVPFYYIEYAISEIAALSLWKKSKEDFSKAVQLYKKGCSLAASKPLPSIYKAFGIPFDFSSKALKPIANMIKKELNLE